MAVDLSTTNREALQPFIDLVEARQKPITVLSFGDSMAESYRSISFVLMNKFADRLGISGYALNNYRNALLVKLNGPAQVLADTSLWYSSYFQLPPGGGVSWETQNSPGGVFANHIGLFYIAQPDGGSLTLSISTNTGPWTPALVLDGYSASAEGRSTNIEVSADLYRIRVDSTDGTNIVIGPELFSDRSPGLIAAFSDYPGISLADVTNVPVAIREPILRALKPDLLIWHMKEDGTDATRQRLIECEQWFSNSTPNCCVMYIGTPYVSLDTNSNWTPDQNAIVRGIALEYGRTYFDCMTPSQSYPWMVSQGFMADQTHENLQGNQYLANFVWDDLFFALRAPRSLTINSDAGALVLEHETFPGVLYHLECSTNLLNWLAVSSSLGDGSVITTNLPQASRQFFRLRLQPGSQ